MQSFNGVLRTSILVLLIIFESALGHATLYVIVIGKGQIAIASDSKWLTFSGTQVTAAEGIEKIFPLGTKIVFMSAGITQIWSSQGTIMPERMAKDIYESVGKKAGENWTASIADASGQVMTDRLNELSASEKEKLKLILGQLGLQDNQVMESIFAGVDDKGQLSVESVDINLSRADLPLENSEFRWSRRETPTDSPNIVLSGDLEVLRRAFEKTGSPIAKLPSFQAWFDHLGKEDRLILRRRRKLW